MTNGVFIYDESHIIFNALKQQQKRDKNVKKFLQHQHHTWILQIIFHKANKLPFTSHSFCQF